MKIALIKAALFTPTRRGWGLPVLLWGEPGVAKTDLIEEVCTSFALPCETLSPGERGEGAFGVIPVPVKGVITYPPPDWSTRMENGGVVFVDELTTAPPALQPSLLGLLLAKRLGGHCFGPRVRVVGAANPPELAASGFDLPAPVANRVGHLDWSAPSVEEHTAYMMRGDAVLTEATSDAVAEEKRVMERWPEPWAKARGLETAFLARRPGLKNQCPKAGDPKSSRAWPSDRSWEAATRALASAAVHGLSDVETEEFVAAFIGEGAASEFFAFRTEADLPDPAALLDGTEKFKHNPARLDRTAAVLNACTSLITPTTAAKRSARAEALWSMLEELTASKADLDILIPAIQALITASLHTVKGAATSLARVQPVLKAAGIRPGR